MLDTYRLENVLHDLVGVVVIGIGQEEDFGTVGSKSNEQSGKTVIALDEFRKILHRQPLQIALDVNEIDGRADVLEHGLVRHEQLANFDAGPV